LHETSAEALLLLKAEFRALSGIHHPGLVRLFDLVVSPSDVFFTMERVHGAKLTEYARNVCPVDLKRTLHSAADAIEALHAHGKLHRDLKPENILVDASGQAHILDFGFVARAGSTAGTLAYMAPEIFQGATASAASDWYAFGVVIYEAMSDRVPVSDGDVPELVLRKRMRGFPRLRDVNPAAPDDLDDLVWSLLEPNPTKRATYEAIANVVASPTLTRRRGHRGAPAQLLGREPELERLKASLERANRGGPSVVLIEGESGVGKSYLVRSFLDQELPDGWATLAGAARPQESVPFLAIDAVVDGILGVIETLDAEPRRALVACIPPSLVRSFPVLGSLDRDRLEPAPVGLDALEGRHEARIAFAALIRRLCAYRPVALWIDDLQWADSESLVFLRAAIEQADAARLFVVLTRRPVAEGRPDADGALLWLEEVERVSLGALDDESARRVLRMYAGDRALGDAAEARALHQADGNAFLLEFLARYAAAQDEPDRLLDMAGALRASLDELQPDARVLFECAALTSQALPLACLGRVLADRAALRWHADHLVARGLLSMDAAERVRPYHDTLRERTQATIDAESRRSRHGALATALDEYGAPPEWSIPHLEGCGRVDAAAAKCVDAGRAAAQRYAFAIAASHYENALRLGHFEPHSRARLLGDLADNLALTGRGPDAATRYEDAAKLLDDERHDDALVMRHRRAISLLRSGEIAGGFAALSSTLGVVGETLPRGGSWAIVSGGIESLRLALLRRGSPVEGDVPLDGADIEPDWGRQSPQVEAGRPQADPIEPRLEALWTSATSLSMYDPLVANVLALRFVRRALRDGRPRWVLRALALEAAFLAALGGRRRGQVHSLMTELRRRAQRAPWPYERAWVAATEGSTAWLAGDVLRCCDWTTRARAMFGSVPQTGAYEFALLDAFRVPALALLGRTDEALNASEAALTASTERGDRFSALSCQHGHITLAYLTKGDRARAEIRSEQARRTSQHSNSAMTTYHQVFSRSTIALFDGEGLRAHEIFMDGWRRVRRAGLLAIESVSGDLRYLRARCALAAGYASSPRSRRVFLDDADSQRRWLRSSTLRMAGACAFSIDSQLAFANGRSSDAQRIGSAAVAELRSVGLVPDAEALARKLEGAAPLASDRVFVPQ
jgi:tRNA A-37 threonylcarbamoyl transferase component Bud32